ncbi:MAG: macro domain-containing protein [bacterium]
MSIYQTSGQISSLWKFLQRGGKELQTELAAIGYCEIGNAVITKGYNLKATHIIFMPYKNSLDEKDKTNFVLLHKGFNSALDLAKLYGAKNIAVAVPYFDSVAPNCLKGILNAFSDETPAKKTMVGRSPHFNKVVICSSF